MTEFSDEFRIYSVFTLCPASATQFHLQVPVVYENSDYACAWKRQDSSVSVVTSRGFKDYGLSLGTGRNFSIIRVKNSVEGRQWSFPPKKQRPRLEADWQPLSQVDLHSLVRQYCLDLNQITEKTLPYCLCL